MKNYSRKSYYILMLFIAYTFKGQVHVFAGQVKIVSHSSCRTSAILKYFCPLTMAKLQHFLVSCLLGKPFCKNEIEGTRIDVSKTRDHVRCNSENDFFLQVVAVHSQTMRIPDCPIGWSGLWIGYSFMMVRIIPIFKKANFCTA